MLKEIRQVSRVYGNAIASYQLGVCKITFDTWLKGKICPNKVHKIRIMNLADTCSGSIKQGSLLKLAKSLDVKPLVSDAEYYRRLRYIGFNFQSNLFRYKNHVILIKPDFDQFLMGVKLHNTGIPIHSVFTDDQLFLLIEDIKDQDA